MVCLLEQLFSREELVPRQWREGLIVNLFKRTQVIIEVLPY